MSHLFSIIQTLLSLRKFQAFWKLRLQTGVFRYTPAPLKCSPFGFPLILSLYDTAGARAYSRLRADIDFLYLPQVASRKRRASQGKSVYGRPFIITCLSFSSGESAF